MLLYDLKLKCDLLITEPAINKLKNVNQIPPLDIPILV